MMKVDSWGNVGIGTTAPNAKLQVAGLLKVEGEGVEIHNPQINGQAGGNMPGHSFVRSYGGHMDCTQCSREVFTAPSGVWAFHIVASARNRGYGYTEASYWLAMKDSNPNTYDNDNEITELGSVRNNEKPSNHNTADPQFGLHWDGEKLMAYHGLTAGTLDYRLTITASKASN